MPNKIEIQEGQKFNKLTYIKETELYRQPNGRTVRKGIFKCDCGIEKEIHIVSVRNNRTISCGCFHKEINKNSKNKKHGYTKTRTYTSWSKMKARCNNPDSHNYKFYGERGIKIYSKWVNSFENFLIDMGERPLGTTIDRIDVNGNYEPNNCRWATPKEQANNRR